MGTTHTRIPDPVHEEAKKVRDQHDYPSIGEAIRHMCQEAEWELKRDEIRMDSDDNGPILKIGGLEINLQVSAHTEERFDSKAESVRTELDSNGDINWWMVYPEDDLGNYVEITPTVNEND